MNKSYSCVPPGVMVYSRKRLLTSLKLTENELICCCLISGNDFVSSISQNEELKLSNFDEIVSFVKQQNLTCVESCAEFYHSLNCEVSVEQVIFMLSQLS